MKYPKIIGILFSLASFTASAIFYNLSTLLWLVKQVSTSPAIYPIYYPNLGVINKEVSKYKEGKAGLMAHCC